MTDTALDTFLGQYLCYLDQSSRISEQTASHYERDLARFISFCKNSQLAKIHEIDASHIYRYVDRLISEDYSSPSIQRALCAIRGFLNHALMQRLIKINHARNIRFTIPKNKISKRKSRYKKDQAIKQSADCGSDGLTSGAFDILKKFQNARLQASTNNATKRRKQTSISSIGLIEMND